MSLTVSAESPAGKELTYSATVLPRGAQFDPEKVDLFFESAAGRIQIIEHGVAVDYSEEEATRLLSEPEVTAIADVKMGTAAATAWGCDLTYDYVKINADYRS